MRVTAFLVLVAACGFEEGIMPDASTGPGGDMEGVDDPTMITSDAAFDVQRDCPATYTMFIDNQISTSRYRGVGTEAAFGTQHAACNADLPGRTHLAALETAEEIMALRDELNPRTLAPSRRYYLGVVQQRDQAAMTAGWLVFTGGALPDLKWSAGQPNDDDNVENNSENIATLNVDDMLNDATGDISYGAICECDGLPIAATIPPLLPP